MTELEYPFDSQYLLRKKRAIKKELLTAEGLTEKKVAVLGGSTTNEIVDIFKNFLNVLYVSIRKRIMMKISLKI